MNDKLLKSKIALKANRKYSNYLMVEECIKKSNNTTNPKLKTAILRNYTTELLTTVIAGEIALMDYIPVFYTADYNVIMQEVVNENSQLYSFNPDVIIVGIWLENISPKLCREFSSLNSTQVNNEKQRVIQEIQNIVNALKKKSKATILINNFVYPGMPSLGIFDLQSSCSQIQTINEINHELYNITKNFINVYIVDILSVFYKMGYDNAFDTKSWTIAQNPLTRNAMINVGIEYGKYLKCLHGKIKKCIVLDCDNTLWGGIVAEVGYNNVEIGDSYPGVCYSNLQKEILNLYNRGVIIALCSKNNEQDVLEVFKNNEQMLLKEEHIAIHKINWENKADNIRSIAKSLNIDLNSLVFVDDSAFECNLVKSEIPEVDVIELNMEISKYSEVIRNCGLFNSLTLTSDDRIRNQSYKDEKIRKNLKSISSSIDNYLADLEMSIIIKKNCIDNIPRISQLTQKTNQFNLTTIRYNEEEIKAYMMDNAWDVFDISLEDKISNLGIVGVAIVKYTNQYAEIDTFLLSCRALGRNIEDSLITVIAETAKNRQCKYIKAKYFITKKNSQVSNFYQKYGFDNIENNEKGTVWQGKDINIKLPAYLNFIAE